jgi:lipid-A-disaccharide synthase
MLDVMEAPLDRVLYLRGHGLDPERPVVALLPGSRRNELRAILPGLAGAARIIASRRSDVQFVLARAPHLPADLFAALTGGGMPPVLVLDHAADHVLAAADVALVASGTVTVQAALHECPMVVVYRLSAVTYRLGRPFVHVDTFAMANLVAGRRIVPELIQDDFTPDAVAGHALRLLDDPGAGAAMRRDLADVRRKLGEPGASRRAAAAVLQVASRGAPNRLG